MNAASVDVRVRLAPLAVGAAWGLGHALTKIAVDGGWAPWGIVFWQSSAMVLVGGGLLLIRRQPLPRGLAAWQLCAMVAFLGTLIPHAATYRAVQDLPAGVMAIVLSTAPMISLPIAIALGLDRADLRRVLGVCLGALGVACIALAGGASGAALPLTALLIAGIAPLCYALNGNILDLLRRADVQPLQLVFGAGLLLMPASFLLAAVTGQVQRPGLSPADLAMLAVLLLHIAGYLKLLWVIRQAGAVYASLANPIVTGFGVLWSMVLLSERYPGLVWLGLLAVIAGLTLVRPLKR